MWNRINQLRRILRVSPWRTLFLNFYMLPLNQAIRLPIILTRNVRFYNLSGKIVLNGIVKTGMVRFGFFGEDNMYWNSAKTLLQIEGRLVLSHNIHIANGIVIRVEKDANLRIDENVRISNEVRIICYNDITIKKNNRIAWECQIMDTTFHYIRNISTKEYNTIHGTIVIGENNWIGNRCNIMKGTKLPNYCIVTSGSLINKDFSEHQYSVLAGSPAKLIKQGVYRVLDKEEMLLKQEERNKI